MAAAIQELMAPDEVAFESGVFLLRKVIAEALKTGAPPQPVPLPEPHPVPERISTPKPGAAPVPEPVTGVQTKTIRPLGTVPPAL